MVNCRELAAVTGPAGDNPARITMEAVFQHEAVVEAVRLQGPALPVQFGTVFPDAASVASALDEQYMPLQADLERLGDKVELSLTALWAARPLGRRRRCGLRDEELRSLQAGARYQPARVAELRRDEALKNRVDSVVWELDQLLGGLALERRVSLLPTPGVAMRIAYLLHPSGVSEFRALCEAAGSAGETFF